METIQGFLDEFLTPARIKIAIKVLVLLVAGSIIGRLLAIGVGRVMTKRLGASQGILARRVVWYGLLFLVIASVMRELGLDLGVLLGAAGILTVAIGFASQTSASNLISGIFLLAERPFTVTDVITVGQTTGEVVAIDLLSVKLRTFDNLLVRIPNETLLKSEIRNITRYPIRRVDIQIGVAYRSDIERVRQLLFAVADDHPLCLDEPRPLFQFLGFGESSLNLQFSAWAARDNFIALKTALHIEIKKTFDREGIEIPFPQRVLSWAADGEPLPHREASDAISDGTNAITHGTHGIER